jgi:hypothetical protein
MKLAVSYNHNGEIAIAFDPSKLKAGKMTVGYDPAPGEHHEVLEVPKHLEGKPLKDIVHLLRVNTSGTPRLEAKS